jgi:hypothetical protein
MKFAMLLGVLGCVSLAHAQPPDKADAKVIATPPQRGPNLGFVRDEINLLNNPLSKVDLSSPENTVRSFVWAISNYDVASARQCVFNAQSLDELRPIQEVWNHGLKSRVNLISDLHAYRDGDNAVVTLRLNFLSNTPRPDIPSGSSERLHLKKFGEIWQILPEKENVSGQLGRVPVLEDWLVDTAKRISKPPSLTAEENWQQCQSNLKKIGKAFFDYTRDYDEKWPPLDDWQ